MGLRFSVVLLFLLCLASVAQQPIDADHDGLSDALEQQLLDQFVPTLMVDPVDCSTQPAQFKPGLSIPSVAAENTTLYGQAFPSESATAHPRVELHYYHLWRTDCGAHGHLLDTEHVAVLVEASTADVSTASWHALYWYAAAHEDTVCDVSQITRASTLRAEDHGATVWVSSGKHASFLDERLCARGCGNDVCVNSVAHHAASVINLGELHHPLNGSAFVTSPQWPLAAKMTTTNFPADALARIDAVPDSDIEWFHPGRHPAQGIIAISSTTAGAIGHSAEDTSAALGEAHDNTGNALDTAARKTKHALGASAGATARFLHLKPKEDATPEPVNQQLHH